MTEDELAMMEEEIDGARERVRELEAEREAGRERAKSALAREGKLIKMYRKGLKDYADDDRKAGIQRDLLKEREDRLSVMRYAILLTGILTRQEIEEVLG